MHFLIPFLLFVAASVSYKTDNYCTIDCYPDRHIVCLNKNNCNPANSTCAPYASDEEYQRQVLQTLNTFRDSWAAGNETNEEIANMVTLTYEPALEFVARCWANTCQEKLDNCPKSKMYSDVFQTYYSSAKISYDPAEIIEEAVQYWRTHILMEHLLEVSQSTDDYRFDKSNNRSYRTDVLDSITSNNSNFKNRGSKYVVSNKRTAGHTTSNPAGSSTSSSSPANLNSNTFQSIYREILNPRTNFVGCARVVKNDTKTLLFCNFAKNHYLDEWIVYGEPCSKCPTGHECSPQFTHVCQAAEESDYLENVPSSSRDFHVYSVYVFISLSILIKKLFCLK